MRVPVKHAPSLRWTTLRPHQRGLTGGEVLAAWRAAERRLTALEPDSQEWAEASQDIERFRTVYHELFRQKAG